jgi:hypothetical protein
MADNYTNFSFFLEMEREARDKAFALYQRLEQAMGITSDLHDPIHPVKDELTAKAVDLVDGMDEWRGFLVDAEDNGLWLRDDNGSANIELVVQYVQAVLQMLELDTVVTFSWADTCSKPCLDSFGGGAVAITRHASDWTNTSQWCEQKVRVPDPILSEQGPLIRSYVQSLGLVCPACGSDAIGGGSVDVNAGRAIQEMSCDACQSSWCDTYDLDGFTELEYGPCALCSQTVFEHGKTVLEGGLFCSPSCAEAATDKEACHD